MKHLPSIPQGATVVGRAGCATGGRVVRAVGGLMRGRDVRAGERARGGLRALRAGCERCFSARAMRTWAKIV